MGWDVIVQLIISEGIPVAEAIWQRWSTGQLPTQADWDVLKALSAQTSLDRAKAALQRAGVPETDPKAQEVIKLTTPPPAA